MHGESQQAHPTHGSVSTLADRIKIARGAKAVDINPSVQHMVELWWCGKSSRWLCGRPVPVAEAYLCDGALASVTRRASRTWPALRSRRTLHERAAVLFSRVARAPVSIRIRTCKSMTTGPFQASPRCKLNYQRGPIACGIDAMPLLNWGSGIISEAGSDIDQVTSVVGWGAKSEKDATDAQLA